MNLLDGPVGDVVEAGTVFDWPSPVLSMLMDVLNEGGYGFLIPQDCGWTGGEIASLLHSGGVGTWGHMITNGCIMITCHPNDASQGCKILDGAGIPYGAPAIEVQEEAQQWESSPAQQEPAWESAWSSVSPFA